MTPAVNSLKKAKVRYTLHSYDHDPKSGAYGEEAAQKLNVSFDRLFKTLVVSGEDGTFMTALVPVSKQLDLKKWVRALGLKKAKMAEKQDVERVTGYVIGGVSPLGQKKKLVTAMDISAQNFDTIFISAGRRGLQIEISPKDLARLTQAVFLDISR
ncbi:MAG: aminoacyl-tRNA deacylase [Deltaproteobacteria bacterium RIFOXYC2_FULL_48_10]|nr:MAG: aminoacyl-tRNA deacylase [Deltaproteobacteria bacterium RIFOXYC2_FULL_48_10]